MAEIHREDHTWCKHKEEVDENMEGIRDNTDKVWLNLSEHDFHTSPEKNGKGIRRFAFALLSE